jgi:hypothetical protein
VARRRASPGSAVATPLEQESIGAADVEEVAVTFVSWVDQSEVWGGAPLGTSDQLTEPGVEGGSWWWVDLSVRSTEYRFAIGAVFDGPAVFVQEPVVVATEQDQIVHIGETAICPMSPVMSMHPIDMVAAGELAAPVSMPQQTP